MSKIVVTGGAGLVGSHIIDLLIKEKGFDDKDEIVSLDNLIRGRRENIEWAMANGPVTFVEGDIRDKELVNDVMQGADIVFHMAALRITHCAAEPRLAMEVMGGATFNVLEAAVNAKVNKVVAASSASIYGMADHFPTDENHHPYNNRTLYGAEKIYLEGLLRSFNEMYGLNYSAMRYFNVYGPRMDIHGKYTEVLIRWMERIADGKAPLIFGDGNQTMDFVYIEDIARSNIFAAWADVSDEVFNVASGVETSLNDLANALLKVMGSDLRPEYGPERSVNPVPRRLASTEKAKRMIGFEAKISLEEGLRRLVGWWREENNRKVKG